MSKKLIGSEALSTDQMTAQTTDQYDLIVVGAGAGGLSAALSAAARGLSVLVLEKAQTIGGTTAWSGGWMWVPGTHLAKAAGIKDAPDAPRAYLKAVLGPRFRAEQVDAFLAAGPEMVAFFEAESALRFECGTKIPDTYGDLPGAGMGGRSVIAAPFDGRALGKAVGLLRKPVRETTFFGMTIQAGPDLRAFLTMTRSFKSFAYASRRVLAHMRDLALYRRGMDMRNGLALAARLLRSALDLGVLIRVDTPVNALLTKGGRVSGVRLSDGRSITARRGVVLATGGYAQDKARRAATFRHDDAHRTLAVPEATGDGLRMATAIGAALQSDQDSAAALCPVSMVNWPDGRSAAFPHIIDRGKPGVIGVLASGARFCNEGLGYHDYVMALDRALSPTDTPQSWLIADYKFLRRYGLGVVRPAPVPWRQWVKRGYLKTGKDIPSLARAAGIDPDGLSQTVAAYNAHAARGEDPAFERGTTAYMRLQGDPDVTPNPCVAPLLTPPFVAVKVVPGSFGTFTGLSCNGRAEVLDTQGNPIKGLWAAGTDLASIFGGHYPAGGIAIGPAMTFGYIAGKEAAGQAATPESDAP